MAKMPLVVLLALFLFGCVVVIFFDWMKPSRGSSLCLSKHDIVGGYDQLYDEYFPRFYHTTGLLSLPFDDIVEPFEAWFAGEKNMSRIDYYYGMDKTIQRGDLGKHGILFKIVPMHAEMKPSDDTFTSCWYRAVPTWLPRAGQSVIPTNLSDFKFVSEEYHRGLLCLKYERKNKQYNKTNTYSLYISKHKPHKPLRYEMTGYDDMLASHYDHYVIDYVTFEPWMFNYTLFNLPEGSKCRKKAKKLHSRYLANPMAEYMHFSHHKDGELDSTYKEYKTIHYKKYTSPVEHEQRKHIFKHNLRYIRSKNRQNLKFKLTPNNFTDMTEDEVNQHRGLLHDKKDRMKPKHSGMLKFNELAEDSIPDELDWRDYGAVTRAHSQGLCGSCWTFSALGAVEGAHFLKTGKLVELSNQELIDCSWAAGNHGCRGGFQDRTLKWVKQNGVALKRDYGPYLAQEGFCHCGESENCTVAHIKGFVRVPKNNSEALKYALVTHGPIASSVNSDRKSFRFYSHGIYDDPECGKKTNHAILTVGYGTHKNISYWIIKNSWGQLWGDNGFIKIAMKNDRCGLTHGPLLAIKKDASVLEFPFKNLKRVPRQRVRSFTEEELTILPF
ncbi:KDEL-tailed cysteine endopeptidase CEP1-like [Acropora millepora]|uniref:KDEL-tailed cysteine endopeptidase CEP1-like n=1 Tax=Acropora millepora TaxID=45264 RepID=UPI001CF18E10|nr:KDEL-tailed cysteine endopeptidase CEP1-like [Acropora millepora]